MTFRILARSNIKDSMTFLIAEPPLRRADRQRCQGDIKLTRVHHGFLRAGALGGEAHLGIPYPQIAERSTAVAAISADCRTQHGGSGHLDGHRRRRGEVMDPIQGHY